MTGTSLEKIVQQLDNFFSLSELAIDPSMGKFVPLVYKSDEKILHELFESTFIKSFNGVMIRGEEHVSKIFAAAFPHDEILTHFLQQSEKGDMLFLHHPIPLETGDPNGTLGRGFLPLNPTLINKIKEKKLTIYSCHAPLDYNETISTTRAIAEALDGKVKKTFIRYGNGNAGLIVNIDPISTKDLITKLKEIFEIPYVDFAGEEKDTITTVGMVAGGGDEVEYSQLSREYKAQAYITGEIFSHQESQWTKENTTRISQYSKTCGISLIGVSHAASEFLVMKTQISRWFNEFFGIPVIPLAQKNWWL